MTRDMLNLQWNSALLYPAGHSSNRITEAARVKLPAGWQQASALQVQSQSGKGSEFVPVSLEKLVDSPLFAGQNVRRVSLDPKYVHSWNGKFRRPADLNTHTCNEPIRNSLLWLYEGQIQFWGKVLAARSGLVTVEQARDGWAQTAASLESRSGRTWRNLPDTTNEGTMGARRTGKDWSNYQRSAD